MKIPTLILFVVLQQIQCVFNSRPEFAISTGLIQGKSVEFRGVTVNQFLGIPYAEPPLKELRFAKSVPKKPWNGVLKADQWGKHCMQPIIDDLHDSKFTFDEDCLILNVFATEAAIKDSQNGSINKLRPVMFWIHGGGFLYGSANDYNSFDGTALVALKDVILVSINYRLGPFGFLHLPEAKVPGNMGLWDQNLALKWVKDNIHYFGGDPNKVTIFGESAGSISVSAHIFSPQSKGLFANAIVMSGSLFDLKRWSDKDIGKTFAQKIGCKNNDYKCLDSYQFDKFPDTQHLMVWPTLDNDFLPTSPEQIVANRQVDSNVNILLGTVGNEGACMIMLKDPITFHPNNPTNLTLSDVKIVLSNFFGKSSVNYYIEKYFAQVSPHDYGTIRLNLAQALGDTILTCPTYVMGRDLALNGHPNVYAYYQSQKPSSNPFPIFSQSSWLPATHGDDIPMVFGHPLLYSGKYSADDVILSYLMMDIWTTFAREGKPPKISHQDWLPWSQSESISYPTMELNANKFGIIETEPLQSCFEKWPFPFEKTYWFDIEPGLFANIKENRDEL